MASSGAGVRPENTGRRLHWARSSGSTRCAASLSADLPPCWRRPGATTRPMQRTCLGSCTGGLPGRPNPFCTTSRCARAGPGGVAGLRSVSLAVCCVAQPEFSDSQRLGWVKQRAQGACSAVPQPDFPLDAEEVSTRQQPRLQAVARGYTHQPSKRRCRYPQRAAASHLDERRHQGHSLGHNQPLLSLVLPWRCFDVARSSRRCHSCVAVAACRWLLLCAICGAADCF